MLPVTWDTVRLFLHVLAATVWVGGQLTLAALVPAVRRYDRAVTRTAAHRFNRLAWPAFGVLVLTGIWNMLHEWPDDHEYQTTLIVKLIAVGVSGLTAFLHQRSKTPTGLAVFGGLSLLAALAAPWLGIMLGRR